MDEARRINGASQMILLERRIVVCLQQEHGDTGVIMCIEAYTLLDHRDKEINISCSIDACADHFAATPVFQVLDTYT